MNLQRDLTIAALGCVVFYFIGCVIRDLGLAWLGQ